MSIFKGSLLVGLCLASFACHKRPPGSKDSNGSGSVDGTGHTGAVAPANGTPGDPNAPAGSAPTGSTTGSAAAVPTGTTAPSGTGNSNTDMANPANGSGSGSAH